MSATDEEGFYLAAIIERQVFFNATDKNQLKAEQENRMTQSYLQFINFNNFDDRDMQQTIISQ